MIKAKGDIEVRGVVEGATLISEGDIILHRGIQGMNKGVLQAEGDVVTKFIESATVKTGGDVKAGAILHSNIDAMGSIICEGKKAFTIGGKLSSISLISLCSLRISAATSFRSISSSGSKVSTYRGILRLKPFSSISCIVATWAYLSTSSRR